jgi:glycosyltransferase involved in cell wall biosynthesis
MTARRLTVLQLLPSLDSGGVERGTLEVGAELVRRGHRSLVISGGGRLVPPLETAGSEHHTWPIGKKSPLTARWVLPLRQFLLREQVDIVHVRSRVPAWVAWLAWNSLPRGRQPHFLTTAHGLYSVNAYSAVMTRGERVIAISRTVEDHLHRNYPQLNPHRIRLIFRGVDPDEFPHGYRPSPGWLEHWRAEFPHLAGRKIVTLPGRLTRLKGHPSFLELIARLRREDDAVHGLIVGGEDSKRRKYADEVRGLVRTLGLERHVTFTGHRSDIRDIYAISRVVVSLSANPPEAFGRTTLEALAMGTPVVGYTHAGIGEILNALFPSGAVAVGRLDRVAERVREILDHGATVPPNELFTQRRMLDETLGVYQELAAA